ncbi:hypothetical protein HZB88_03440 [archaeon]|nr:hypothetical protein [archaeon]
MDKLKIPLECLIEGLIKNPGSEIIPVIEDNTLNRIYLKYAENRWTEGILRLKEATGKLEDNTLNGIYLKYAKNGWTEDILRLKEATGKLEDNTLNEIYGLAKKGEFKTLSDLFGGQLDLEFIKKEVKVHLLADSG